MTGKIIHKNSKAEMKDYTNTAIWCNANNAHIEDKGEYYEVVENPETTVEEKLSELDQQYDSDKATLVAQYADALMHDDTDTANAIKSEMVALDEQYDIDYEAIVSEDEEE